jgi:hydroxyacylglutathione hydrolase
VGGGPFDSNIYLVSGAGTNVLIDAGTGFHDREVIASVEDMLGGGDLHAILLTHEHVDHSGGALKLSRRFRTSVHCSPICAEILEGPDLDLTGCSLFGIEMSPIDDIERLGDRFEIGDLIFDVIPSPGHCRGQVSFIEKEEKALFCGDLIFCDGGVGRWDLPGGNLREHRESIKRSLEWEVSSLHPGHGRSEYDDPKGQMRLSYSMIA